MRLQKSSNVFNQPDPGAANPVSGGIQAPNQSVIAPVADRLSNAGNVGLNYQFAANSMIGASGTFSNLHYPNAAEVPGLYDSASQGGTVFYAVRVSKMHYLGATYQYQRLLSYPAPGTNETQTHAVMAFYTLYVTSKFSISAFGGPQYANVGTQFSTTAQVPGSAFTSWNPSAGASMSWQGRRTQPGPRLRAYHHRRWRADRRRAGRRCDCLGAAAALAQAERFSRGIVCPKRLAGLDAAACE